MTRRKALGRGLASLIPEPPAGSSVGVQRLDPGLIDPNPEQPRKRFVDEAAVELERSVKLHGVLQPVIVRRSGARYELVVGERRWRAAVAAGLDEIPVVVREMDDRQRVEVALIENVQREDLNPLEEARACQLLVERFALSHDALAKRLGKSRPYISNLLRIMELCKDVRELVGEGRLSAGHAKALAGVADRGEQAKMARQVVERSLTVRQTEAWVARTGGRGSSPAAHRSGRRRWQDDPNVKDAQERLKAALGTPVAIRGRPSRGRIEIAFSGAEELQRLFEVLESAARAATPPPAARVHHVPLPGGSVETAKSTG
ncbi:MAG: ParB/RepB/Spo0J family partition protein [Acidobacteriota bacterium]